MVSGYESGRLEQTFFFPNVFQCERETRVLPLYYPHFAKGALSNHPEQAEMIEVDCFISRTTDVSNKMGPKKTGEKPRTFIAESHLLSLRISHLLGV